MERQATVDDMLRDVSAHVRDPRVLDALRRVRRERFVPRDLRAHAYEDRPLPIGDGQTISQPTIVGMMTEALRLRPTDRVLEIGTGSGYQAAVLACLAAEVVSVELFPALRERAQEALRDAGVSNVQVLPAGPTLGAPQHGPYDAIVVTAAASEVPSVLVEQLRPGGRLVIPVGDRAGQQLLLVELTARGLVRTSLGGCRFVPLLGPGGLGPQALDGSDGDA